jgi:hypothetical protein
VKATPAGRLLFQLAVSMPRTEEIGSGLWQTPDTGEGGTSGLLKEGKDTRPNGQPIQVRLVGQVNNERLWPTPRTQMTRPVQIRKDGNRGNLEEVVAELMYPTPTARDHMDGKAPYYRDGKLQQDTVGRVVGGSLNPQWVEWLMGFPEGWTDLKPSETPSSRKSPRKSDTQSSKRRK